ncbi:MAG: YgjV family protein [Clostridia bacterium]|nr:YgjV family protein [Clostridia bacterium]
MYIVGQILGIIAVILGFICFQMKSPRVILIFQIIVASVFVVHYICIGSMTAMALNIVAAVQCVCYYFRDKKGSRGLFLPVFFSVVMVIASILTWGEWYSVFIMTGLVVNAVSLAFSSAHKIRVAMLIKAPLCLIYNVLAGSIGGVIYESALLVSSVVGIIKKNKDGEE